MVRAGGVAIVAAALLAGSAAGARERPDLVVASVGDPPLTVVAGGTVRIAETVRNGGRGRAGRSSSGYYLSTDVRVGKSDVRLPTRRAVGALPPRKRKTRNVSVRIPARTRVGAYHLIACADSARRVSERSERNNCRASKRRVAVSLRPRPLTVTPVLDAARASAATVGPEGGVLTATAATGATVTLEIPPAALLSDVTITMTPLSSVTGLPFRRGLVAAVDLAPDGLRFLSPATLRITPAAPVAEGDRTGFSYRGNGEAFHLHRSRAEGGSIALTVTHFSGAGVAQADGSERAGFAAGNPPADAADQAEQQAAVPVDSNALEAAVVTMYATILGMAQNRFTIDQAIMFYNVWYPTAIGSRAGGLWPVLHGQLTAKMLQFVAEARAACVAQRALDEAGWMLRIGLQSQLLVPPAPNVVQAAAEAVASCVRFELDVAADVANNLEIDRGRMQARVAGLPVTVTSGFTPDRLSGSKAIEVLDYRIDDFDCWVHTWNPQPARPLQVLSMRLSGLNPGAPGVPSPVQVESTQIDFGSVDDQVTHTCSDGSSFTNAMGIWDSGVPTIVGGDRITWTRTGQGAWTRGYERAAAPGEPSGTVTFTLRHAPR